MKELLRRRLCFFGITFLSAVWMAFMLSGPPDDAYDSYYGERVMVSGKVSRKEIKANSYAVYLSGVRIAEVSGDSGAESKKYKSDKAIYGESRLMDSGLVCYLGTEGRTYDALPCMGERICVEGKIGEFRIATNPGQFDMKNYYLYKGYDANMYADAWESASLAQDKYHRRSSSHAFREDHFSNQPHHSSGCTNPLLLSNPYHRT